MSTFKYVCLIKENLEFPKVHISFLFDFKKTVCVNFRECIRRLFVLRWIIIYMKT